MPTPRPSDADRTAVVLINVGTPDAPTVPAVRRFLRALLSDPRVVRMPRLLWWPLLHGIVLRTRPRKLAERYAALWTPEGSPLQWHTERQARLLRGFLGHSGHAIRVACAMRHGQPSIPATLTRLADDGCARVLLLPLYPQYGLGTTASALDVAVRWADSMRDPPELEAIHGFARDPDYIAALAASVRRHWATHGRPESSYRLLMSFHGIPEKAVAQGDPYHDECLATCRLLGDALELDGETAVLAFQSRFGFFSRWLQPCTSATLENFGRRGIERVDVLCPGFPADCLETLEEIAIIGKATFLGAGGREYFYIPCLNENEEWIRALERMVTRRLFPASCNKGAEISGFDRPFQCDF